MKRGFSTYLDLVRFMASALVVIYHSTLRAWIKRALVTLMPTNWWQRGNTASLAAKPAGQVR